MSMQDRQRVVELELRVTRLECVVGDLSKEVSRLVDLLISDAAAASNSTARGTVSSEKIVAAVRGALGRK